MIRGASTKRQNLKFKANFSSTEQRSADGQWWRVECNGWAIINATPPTCVTLVIWQCTAKHEANEECGILHRNNGASKGGMDVPLWANFGGLLSGSTHVRRSSVKKPIKVIPDERHSTMMSLRTAAVSGHSIRWLLLESSYTFSWGCRGAFAVVAAHWEMVGRSLTTAEELVNRIIDIQYDL